MNDCLEIATRRHGRTLEITLIGELDMPLAVRLLRGVEQFIEQGVLVVRVDLRGVSFLESGGVKALLCTQRSLRTRGGRLLLTRPSTSVRRIFGALGLDSFLPAAA